MKKAVLAIFLLFLVPALVLAADSPWPKFKSDEEKAKDAYSQGVKYSDAKKYDKAIPEYQKAIKLKPNFPEAYNNLGFALRETGKLDDAIVAYKKALEQNPNLAQAHEYIGVAYLKKGDKASAMKHYEILKKLDPKEAKELAEEIEKYEKGAAK